MKSRKGTPSPQGNEDALAGKDDKPRKRRVRSEVQPFAHIDGRNRDGNNGF